MDQIVLQETDEVLFNEESIILYKRRWAILGVYSLSSFINACIWIGFAPISPQIAAYYNISEDSIDLFSLLFIMTFIPGIILSLYISRGMGIASSFKTGSFLMALGTSLRLLSYVIPNPSSKTSYWYAMIFVGQALCGLAQPLLTTLSSAIATKWFGKGEALFAMFVASLSNPIGIAFGALLSQKIVNATSDVESALQVIFMIHTLFSTAVLLSGILFFDENPPTPPSIAANQLLITTPTLTKHSKSSNKSSKQSTTIIEPSLRPVDLTGVDDDLNEPDMDHVDQNCDRNNITVNTAAEMTMWEHFKYVWRPILKDLKFLFTNRNFFCLSIPFSLGMLVFNILISLPNKIYTPFLPDIDQHAASLTATLITSGLVGSVVVSIIMELSQRFRPVLKIGFILAGSAFILFFFLLTKDISTKGLYLFISGLGGLSVPLLPLTLENGAESLYPMNLQLINAAILTVGQLPSIPGLLIMMSLLNQDNYTTTNRALNSTFGIAIMVILAVAILIVLFYSGQPNRSRANKAVDGDYIPLDNDNEQFSIFVTNNDDNHDAPGTSCMDDDELSINSQIN